MHNSMLYKLRSQLSASSHLVTMCAAPAAAACGAVVIASLMCLDNFKRLMLGQVV